MAFDLTATANLDVAGDFDERADECAVANRTAKDIDQLPIENNDARSQFDIRIDHVLPPLCLSRAFRIRDHLNLTISRSIQTISESPIFDVPLLRSRSGTGISRNR